MPLIRYMEYATFGIRGVNAVSVIDAFAERFPDAYNYASVSGNTEIFALERFSLRISSTLAVIVIFDYQNRDVLIVNVMAAGGKSGIFQISWGAESSRLNSVIKSIREIASERGLEVVT